MGRIICKAYKMLLAHERVLHTYVHNPTQSAPPPRFRRLYCGPSKRHKHAGGGQGDIYKAMLFASQLHRGRDAASIRLPLNPPPYLTGNPICIGGLDGGRLLLLLEGHSSRGTM